MHWFLNKVISITKDSYRAMPFPDFIAFLWSSLFKNERIVIYCRSLQESDNINLAQNALPIVKGELPDLESGRKLSALHSWEFQCDLYDGVRDFFWYKENGRIGHISWLYYKGDPNRVLRLTEKECEIKYCLTRPELRGKGLYPAALQQIQRYLKKQGYQRCYICVKDDNTPSIRGIEKSGFQPIGSMCLLKAFGVQISRRRTTSYLSKAVGN
ncbi:MAG: GNAT family N-acetyltransferase [Gammaproteobacteria bacterium]